MSAVSYIATPILQRPRNFEWFWRSDDDSRSAANSEQWKKFSDVENEILEDGWNEKRKEVEIDGNYIINFSDQVQYHKDNDRKQQAVKRIQLDKDRGSADPIMREERFLAPIALANSSLVISPQIQRNNDDSEPEWWGLVKLGHIAHAYRLSELKGNKKSIANVIEDAADGIVKEGTVLGKAFEAKWLSEQLLAVKNFGVDCTAKEEDWQTDYPTQIGETCINLYTKESFLYKLMNSTLRNASTITRERFKTLGPFIWLLDEYLGRIKTIETLTLYRGLNLDEEQRKQFMQQFVIFNSFTSTSKSRQVAEFFHGNTLLILNIDGQNEKLIGWHAEKFGASISHCSAIPSEEEYLLMPTGNFRFVKAEYDDTNKTHLIYLTTPAFIYVR
ncbi:unnamed protein product [Didymodactylos carnosus]|uniref:NAD(P)(+)--arginine ADP-ribosyltransferase n=1 Tax=Didymodactylos carnosus TaxID=1234261 RepID=A0A815AJQ3_9BILA|nr:unnamed protein product [Didymodactylos carnosus]CAF1256708.1 unnamed protein product [Didymodactylos carnosus]CAF3992674.1 unnamed protein product [Didymodactylos carnosus]CAF4030394.1 unnamed protein product [Didymodactylos carnosus]